MDTKPDKDKILLAHHEQQPLCTTRLPYRQGRKLTAVKVYTINDESRHLLVFGVPSLNLRQETKCLFQKFGKIIQFNISPYHEAEKFTETYHLIYEKIQAARVAKRMLDTKNFYGGLLHICYSPEYESVQETRQKLIQRKKDVVYRLQCLKSEEQKINLPKMVEKRTDNTAILTDAYSLMSKPGSYNLELPSHMIQNTFQIYQSTSSDKVTDKNLNQRKKINMGEINTICIGKQIRDVIFKPKKRKVDEKIPHTLSKYKCSKIVEKSTELVENGNLEVIDATSVDNEIVTNIKQQVQENLEQKEIVIKKIPQKPINIIKFNLPNKKS